MARMPLHFGAGSPIGPDRAVRAVRAVRAGCCVASAGPFVRSKGLGVQVVDV